MMSVNYYFHKLSQHCTLLGGDSKKVLSSDMISYRNQVIGPKNHHKGTAKKYYQTSSLPSVLSNHNNWKPSRETLLSVDNHNA